MLKAVAKWTGRKSIYAGLLAFIGWSGIEMYDGASTRMQTRYVQAKDAVAPPLESTWEWCSVIASRLWVSIEHNPGPTLITLVLFIGTILYHKMKGQSIKEAFASTLTRSEPAKPRIILKAEQELMYQQLVSTETTLEAQLANLPNQIREAAAVAETLDREATRAEEAATTKRSRAKAATVNHARLTALLSTAKHDLLEVREQLGRAE